MKHLIKYGPSYSLLEIQLDEGEQITAEAGAMTYMGEGVELRTRTRKVGFFSKIKLTLLGGETFFINDFVASKPGKVGLVSAPLGDIAHLKLSPGKGYIIQKGAYIASTGNVKLDTRWEGFKGVFGQGLFMLRAIGEGDVFISTFGAIDIHELAPGEKLVVDNYHLTAFSDTCEYIVRKVAGLKETVLGGEGLVCEVTGPGEVYVQTKNPKEFVDWIWPMLRRRIRRYRRRR